MTNKKSELELGWGGVGVVKRVITKFKVLQVTQSETPY